MAESYHANLLNVADAYAKMLGIKVIRTSLSKSLTENPYLTSLYPLSNTLGKFNIECAAFKVCKENIDSLSAPFIAYLSNQKIGKDFVPITSVDINTTTYIAKNRKPKAVLREAFVEAILKQRP